MSQVVIAGGSGYLGRALASRLAREGHQVVVLTRRSSKFEGRSSKDGPPERAALPSRIRYAEWTPDGSAGAWAEEMAAADAVVNLAGAGIADKRWTDARKRLLVDSRILSTRSLVAAISSAERRPSLFVQASGIGYYGSYDDGPTLDESSPPGHDFLANLCVMWEGEAQPVQAFDCRLVIIRSGIVLSKDGGALKKMMLPFRLFAGGPLGSGRQQMSWIHRDDWIGLVAWIIRQPLVTGIINATAPNPVPNWEFSRTLGRAMRRPSWAPVPGFVLRLAVVEMADVALLRGQRVLPLRAQELGFAFRLPELKSALAAEFSG
jgi:uncharacterized protein (TIGR01777 family)